MQLEDLMKTPHLSVKLEGSFFNIVNFTPVIQYIHNLSIDKISEFDNELKFNNKQHRKYIFHYFIYYTCEILKIHNKKNKPVIYFDTINTLNKNYSCFLDIFIKKFPVIVLQEPVSFKEFKKKLKCNGISEEINISLKRKLNKLQTNRFYFSKLHYFCKHYELTFLDKTYFNDIRNKLSLL